METAFAVCEVTVRKFDPDRYFSALFAPARVRPQLFALYAFNHELARVGEMVREPMMGEVRLQWWRETVEDARAGKIRDHDVARALAQLFARTDLPHDLFERMMDARVFDFTAEAFADESARDAYLDSTSGNLMRLAGRILGSSDAPDTLAREAGIAYGLAGLIRAQAFHRARGKIYIHDSIAAASSARTRLARAKHLPKPGTALPAILPATLVPLYLQFGEREVPLHRKQLAMLSASLRGRI